MTIFDVVELTRVVDLQKRSYRLLRWVGDALQSGTLHFPSVHASMELSAAAHEWIERSWEGLPADARPPRENIDAFAHLFASYLMTSYDLIPQPGTQRLSATGCYCSFCAYLANADHLRVKTPDKKAVERAGQMKDLYLAALGDEIVGPLPYAVREALRRDPALAEDVSFATYGQELLRRSQFASQGEGILILWREIAWDKRGKLNKKFVLTAERILQAERAIANRIESLTA